MLGNLNPKWVNNGQTQTYSEIQCYKCNKNINPAVGFVHILPKVALKQPGIFSVGESYTNIIITFPQYFYNLNVLHSSFLH